MSNDRVVEAQMYTLTNYDICLLCLTAGISMKAGYPTAMNGRYVLPSILYVPMIVGNPAYSEPSEMLFPVFWYFLLFVHWLGHYFASVLSSSGHSTTSKIRLKPLWHVSRL